MTLQPVEILDVDAAIIFADLLLPVEPMGLRLKFVSGEGPHISNPVRTSDDVDSLSISNTDDLRYVGEAIELVVRQLAGRVPVIGFVGARSYPLAAALVLLYGLLIWLESSSLTADAAGSADPRRRGAMRCTAR